MSERVGQQLGNYRLLRHLGTGGFAEVYEGKHVYLDTLAAIKVLQTRLEGDEREHFLQEARLIAHLVHPHIIRVLEFGVADNVPYLVMDYAPHGSLRQHFSHGVPLSPPTILPYIKQVASALDYAHEHQLVHRDVKPENMLLGADDNLLLSDFGIALIVQSARFQSTQEVYGTATNMAPEQIQGKAQPASDQYALGVTVYEWLSGEAPFRGSFSELCSQHLFVPPPPLHEKVLTISPAIEAVVEKALAKDPQSRYPNVEAMALAFEDACQVEADAESGLEPTIRRPVSLVAKPPGEAFLAPTLDAKSQMPATQPVEDVTAIPPTQPVLPPTTPVPPLSPLNKWHISRRKMIVAGGLAGLAVATGGLSWYLIARTQATPSTATQKFTEPPSPVPSSSSITLGTTLLTYTAHAGTVYGVSWSPNGQYIASGSADTTVRVWNVSSGDTLYTYHGHSGLFNGVFAVGWASDGRHIASGGADKTVQVADAANGNRIFTYQGHTARVLTLAWSHDDRSIASAGGDKTVQVWDSGNGKLLYTYVGHTATVYTLAWSPDGKYIASGSGDKTVQVWDATHGTLLYTYHGHTDLVYAVGWSPDGKAIASAGADRTVQVWDALTGKKLYTYHGHTGLSNVVSTVAWSPDGKRIASGSTDKTVQVWDATTGNNAYIYHKHTETIFVVAWSPNGQDIASGSADHTVRIWQAV